MLNIERYNLILQMLEERRSIRLQDIVEKLNISEATVRRDLNFLEKSGKLKRVRGGATFIDEKEEDIDYKKVLNLKGKNKIAKEAAAQINDGDIMFLDAGSTTQCVIKYLKEKKNIKVVTNGFTHIQELTNLGIETYIVGGKIKKRTGAVVGSIATHLLGKYNFDVVLLGANAVNEEGYFTPDPEEVIVKRKAMEKGNKIYFLCDKSKLNKKNFIKFAKLNSGILITDGEIPENIEKKIKEK